MSGETKAVTPFGIKALGGLSVVAMIASLGVFFATGAVFIALQIAVLGAASGVTAMFWFGRINLRRLYGDKLSLTDRDI